jgi:hypothetical protein
MHPFRIESSRAKSNSATIEKKFCITAIEKVASVDFWVLNDLNFRGCQACYGNDSSQP